MIKPLNGKQKEFEAASTASQHNEPEAVGIEELDKLQPDNNADDFKERSHSSVVAIVKLLPLALSAVTLVYLFHISGQVAKIARERERVLVQTIEGRSIVAQEVDNYVRTPATIEKTVKLWTDLTFNWVQKLPNGERDPGKRIGAKVFPTRLVEGSSLMSPQMQKVWYEVFQQRNDYLPRNFLGSNATRIFFPSLQTTSKPPIDPRTGQPITNRYEVEVFGDWIEYSSDSPQGTLIDRLALKLRLRPVVKTEPPVSGDADSLQKASYALRANGLEIYDIQRIPNVR